LKVLLMLAMLIGWKVILVLIVLMVVVLVLVIILAVMLERPVVELLVAVV